MSESPSSRRAFLQTTGLGVAAAALLGPTHGFSAEATAKKAAKGGPANLTALNRFGRVIREYCVARVREIERQSNERRAGIRQRADAEAYVRDVRSKIQSIFGPWPE